jgi:hypothetical protein
MFPGQEKIIYNNGKKKRILLHAKIDFFLRRYCAFMRQATRAAEPNFLIGKILKSKKNEM